MTAEAPDQHRCPTCGAAVRWGDPWCTLCYTDLRPPAPPQPEPEPDREPVEQPPSAFGPVVIASPDPLTAPLEAVPGATIEGPTWPCSACGTINRMERDVCVGCGLPFLSGVHAHEALLELPVVGDITKLSRGHRFALAFGVIAVFAVLTILLGLLFR